MDCKIKYVVNKEKRTVVAYMDGCEDDVLLKLKAGGFCAMFDNWALRNTNLTHWNDYKINHCYHDKAVCAEEDEWDEEYGKTLARNRMLQKYYDACRRKLELFYRRYKIHGYDVLTNALEYCERKIDKADDLQL